jgi:hypothetical protein
MSVNSPDIRAIREIHANAESAILRTQRAPPNLSWPIYRFMDESGPGDARTSRGLDDTYIGGDAMAQLIADSGFDRVGSGR